MAKKILEVRDLTVGFPREHGLLKATDHVSFSIEEGQTLCIVGESGSGKSVTSMAIMRLIDYAGGIIAEGKITFDGEELTTKKQSEMNRIRGERLAMIFQDPMSALNPVFSVGDQIAESLRIHKGMNAKDAWNKAVEMLKLVGIPEAEIRAKQYPFEMSGGMCQRVVIAMALACDPELIIADEPTTALDVTIQAQILDLLRRLKRELRTATLLITHDMGVAAEMADRIAVMYAGTIVEEGTVDEVFRTPRHPYTVGLLRSIPRLEEEPGSELYTIQGSIPGIGELPQGCRFHPRCPHAMSRCFIEEPSLLAAKGKEGHRAACWLEGIPEVSTR
ncbi:ABC transporter ATP-binding protein [Paenibacillus glycinis]|uniref:ATP-binding cassette domain-containing protein n=1 Tax=Paenibacillus glycinis TaxID=2697035 RepID=A0ABW9XYI7_9BACL|nr:ABC transporter ATP-binding protein [Paenibacillus glycinis]NBD27694.1 ATP-binding cassette domain-containing protein [Paenibacillus glycinis]